MKVRLANVADATGIADAQIRCWRWAYRGILRDDFLDGLAVEGKSADWRAVLEAPEAAVWVGEMEGAVQGMIVAAPAHWADMPVNGMVRTFYIAPEAAGKGLGRRLWAEAQEYLRLCGHDGMYVMVMEANGIGRGFYEKIGGVRHHGDFVIALDGVEQADCCYYWRF